MTFFLLNKFNEAHASLMYEQNLKLRLRDFVHE
jgi:hypothetical protein